MRYTLPELRAKHKMSQKDVAEAVGVSVQSYNAWEKNYGMVQVSYANAIANVFGLTLDDIFFTPKHENNSCLEK